MMQNTLAAAQTVASDGMIYMPMEAAREAMIGMSMSEWLADVYCEYLENYRKGGSAGVTNDFEMVTGHPPHSYETFAGDFVQYFGNPNQ